jgi:hypothetical protein
MRPVIILTFLSILISCDNEAIKVIENCQLTKTNKIQALSRVEFGTGDTLQVQLNNVTFNLRLYSVEVTERFYDYKLKKRTGVFGVPNGDLVCLVTFYYPADSSYFNNNDYINKFGVKDNNSQKDRALDSLAFAKQCSFDLYLEVTDKLGLIYKSQDKDNLSTDFFQSDSIRYINRDMVDFAQYRVLGHFKTTVIGDNGNVSSISGNLKMTFETNRN